MLLQISEDLFCCLARSFLDICHNRRRGMVGPALELIPHFHCRRQSLVTRFVFGCLFLLQSGFIYRFSCFFGNPGGKTFFVKNTQFSVFFGLSKKRFGGFSDNRCRVWDIGMTKNLKNLSLDIGINKCRLHPKLHGSHYPIPSRHGNGRIKVEISPSVDAAIKKLRKLS